MLRKVNVIILGIAVIFLLSGCGAVKSPTDLIKRPKTVNKTNEVQRIISEFLSHEDTITLAMSQKNEEAVRRVDLDGDKTDEMLLLYKSSESFYEDRSSYGVIILKKKEDKWYEINRINGYSHGIDLVDYKDITGDKLPEIFIGYKYKDNPNKSLSIYSYHGGYFRTIYNAEYRDFGLEDLNDDKKNELILLNRLSDNSTVIRVLNYIDENMNLIDKYLIDNNSYYSTMNVGNASKYKKGIFVDFDMGTYFHIHIY